MRTPWFRRFFTLLILLLSVVPTLAAVRRVPADYPTIQSAIDSSVAGDIVLVSPGSYSGNINFRGKAITVTSTNISDPEVVQKTVIRPTAVSSVVTFSTGEKSNSVLAGFTIIGGYGTLNPAIATDIRWGAGIYCYQSSPTIVGNIIVSNSWRSVPTNHIGYGGGIACINSDAVILRNRIMQNYAYAGGGILSYLSNPRIVSNVIYSNSAVVGGGVALIGGGKFLNNTVVTNDAEFAGNIYAASDAAGRCLLSNNIVAHAPRGGGIYVDNQDPFTQFAFNDVWSNIEGDYLGSDRTGLNGNISEDPLFVDAPNRDYHLQDGSPCINAGDPKYEAAVGELDFYGHQRVYAKRVDIGAAEYSDNFRPLADAGPDQLLTVTALPAPISLDGSASLDLNGAVLAYQWSQLNGPTGVFSDAQSAKPIFYASELGTYVFVLVVSNGTFSSFTDSAQIIVTNAPPIADAGDSRLYSDPDAIDVILLDGSRSFDPEMQPLSYSWKQISGWKVQLSDPHAVSPSFPHAWPGAYVFELNVHDGLIESQPDLVTIVIGPNHAPVADAGPSRYIASGTVTLDGTRSYDPDGVGTLTYQWRQTSGPALPISGTNSSRPVVTVTPRGLVQRCTFELVVSDGELISAPSTNTLTIVPNYGSNVLVLNNPPFDPTKPTIVAFGGGNCTTGTGMTFGGVWEQRANWITVNTYGPSYTRYGDMLMVYLSNIAPDYEEPIQTMGFSTGNLPGMDVAWYVNTTFRDPRYTVNRVSLLDPVCSNLSGRVNQFNASPIAGEQCWVDNYLSRDPNFNQQPALAGALNIICNPARAHAYPVNRYASSSLEYTNNGLTAFAYLSLIGDGKNYQLKAVPQKYYFSVNPSEALVFFNQGLYPGRILAPVFLQGPTNNTTIDANGVVLSCSPVQNAVGYQLLFGTNPKRVMDFAVVSDTTNPPTQLVVTLPHESTWWTIRAYDQFGSTIHADPQLIKLPANRPPVANAGPDLIVYTDMGGLAVATLHASQSIDPDGDALTFSWAWAVGGNTYFTNGESLAIQLPVGEHTIQLMANDGQENSEPDEVTITVVGPLECKMKIAPSTINLKSKGLHILARIQLPRRTTVADVDDTVPLRLHPGGHRATKQWHAAAAGQINVFASFNRKALVHELEPGTAELTVVGKLRTGQWFFGRDIIQVIGKEKDK